MFQEALDDLIQMERTSFDSKMGKETSPEDWIAARAAVLALYDAKEQETERLKALVGEMKTALEEHNERGFMDGGYWTESDDPRCGFRYDDLLAKVEALS